MNDDAQRGHLGSSGSPGDRAASIQAVRAENERLRKELTIAQRDKAMYEGLLMDAYEQLYAVGGGAPIEFAVSDAGAQLFEQLGDAFTLDEALDEAAALNISPKVAAGQVRVLIEEGMLHQNGTAFAKTGKKTYF